MLGASVVVADAAWMTNPLPHPVVRLEMLLCSPLLEPKVTSTSRWSISSGKWDFDYSCCRDSAELHKSTYVLRGGQIYRYRQISTM